MERADARQPGVVLVLAPFARDTAHTCDLLERAGIDARSCTDIEELCGGLGDGAGAILVMEEALSGEALDTLLAALQRQPRWSDIPLLLVVDARHRPDDAPVRHFTEALGNVTLLTRPAHPVTLVSAVRSALRARERQYRLRDALGPYEESYSRLVDALPIATFVHLDGRVIYANSAAAALLGLDEARAIVGQPLARWLHPDFAESEARLAALAGGSGRLAETQRWRRADGEEIEVDVDGAPMIWGRRPAVRACVYPRRPVPPPGESAAALAHLPVVLFQQDRELRYVWVHRFFTDTVAAQAIGRRDADLLREPEEARALEEFKREVLATRRPGQRRLRLTLAQDEERYFDLRVAPLPDAAGLVGVAVDISEYAQLEARLRGQSERLTQSDRRKDEFLAQLAHELRNPLAPIQNAVHVLRIQGDPPDAAHVRWAVDVVGRQVQLLTRLVDDLLDVARITQGEMRLRRERVELGRVLAQSIETVRPLATGRRQVLTYSPPAEPLYVHGDAVRLTQIVVNLLSNAARYTPMGGNLGLSAEGEAGHALIRVRDTGIGLAPEERARIFEPFQQARRPPDAGPAGLGIGLALVKHLVELHQGTVEARSEGPGKGSEFQVRLPRAPGPQAPAPAEPDEAAAARRVLVVDDDADVAQSFALLLGLMGYQVRVAHDGAGGLNAAVAFRPHVVFIDIGLPDMDGYALARALRGTGAGAPMRLVALTGYTLEEVRERSVTAGFDAHLLKPVGADTLERLLESLRNP